jgi:hypothetical protein
MTVMEDYCNNIYLVTSLCPMAMLSGQCYDTLDKKRGNFIDVNLLHLYVFHTACGPNMSCHESGVDQMYRRLLACVTLARCSIEVPRLIANSALTRFKTRVGQATRPLPPEVPLCVYRYIAEAFAVAALSPTSPSKLRRKCCLENEW